MATQAEYKKRMRARRDLQEAYWKCFYGNTASPGDEPMERSFTQEYLRYSVDDDAQFHVAVVLPVLEPGIRIEFCMSGQRRHDRYDWFLSRRSEIEAALGPELPIDWRRENLPFHQQCQIGRTLSHHNPEDHEAWPDQHRELAHQLRLFRATCVRLVRELHMSLG